MRLSGSLESMTVRKPLKKRAAEVADSMSGLRMEVNIAASKLPVRVPAKQIRREKELVPEAQWRERTGRRLGREVTRSAPFAAR